MIRDWINKPFKETVLWRIDSEIFTLAKKDL